MTNLVSEEDGNGYSQYPWPAIWTASRKEANHDCSCLLEWACGEWNEALKRRVACAWSVNLWIFYHTTIWRLPWKRMCSWRSDREETIRWWLPLWHLQSKDCHRQNINSENNTRGFSLKSHTVDSRLIVRSDCLSQLWPCPKKHRDSLKVQMGGGPQDLSDYSTAGARRVHSTCYLAMHRATVFLVSTDKIAATKVMRCTAPEFRKLWTTQCFLAIMHWIRYRF